MVRKPERDKQPRVLYRNFWGVTKRPDLVASLKAIKFGVNYQMANPLEANFFSFRPSKVTPHYMKFLASLGIKNPDADAETASLIWMNVLAIGFAHAYLTENADGIRGDWPRIPLPNSKKFLLASAGLGRQVAGLLDTGISIPGVTSGTVRPELKAIAGIARIGGGSLKPEAGELDVTAGWGYGGKNAAIMPGKGLVKERDYSAEELNAFTKGTNNLGLTDDELLALLGEKTFVVYLNGTAYWKNLPEKVWDYTIGGYQVIKKWLSYREKALLGRGLTLAEVTEVTNMARRIAALLLLGRALDANYQAIKASPYPWAQAKEPPAKTPPASD